MSHRPVVFTLSFLLTFALLLPGAALVNSDSTSTYRAFRLGESAADVAKQAGTPASGTRSTATRPNRVEELDWRTTLYPVSTSGGSKPDSVRQILFRFYNGSLFEMDVTYDRDQTSGLTDTDMTEALSAIYGPASAPASKEISFDSGFPGNVRAIAQWGGPQSLLSLVGFPYGGGFGVVVSSPADQTAARLALLESDRLDLAEAPQKELDRQAKRMADAQASDEKSRSLNKPGFRP